MLSAIKMILSFKNSFQENSTLFFSVSYLDILSVIVARIHSLDVEHDANITLNTALISEVADI